MKVKLIGTGAIYTKYNSACTLIDDKILVDIGSGNHKALLKQGVDDSKIETILVTHLHGDHYADIVYITKHMFVWNLRKEITIIGPKGLKQTFKDLLYAYHGESIEEIEENIQLHFIELKGEKVEEINLGEEYQVKAVLVSHGCPEDCFGYVINQTIGVTGDTGLCEGVEQIWKESQIMIADVSYREGDTSHMGIKEMENLLKKDCSKKIIGTHLRDQTREEAKNFNISHLIFPKDGDEFEI